MKSQKQFIIIHNDEQSSKIRNWSERKNILIDIIFTKIEFI